MFKRAEVLRPRGVHGVGGVIERAEAPNEAFHMCPFPSFSRHEISQRARTTAGREGQSVPSSSPPQISWMAA